MLSFMQFLNSKLIVWHLLPLSLRDILKSSQQPEQLASLEALGLIFRGHYVYYILMNFKDAKKRANYIFMKIAKKN